MQYITLDDLKTVGVTATGDEAAQLLDHLNEQLETRVGSQIVESLDDEKLDEYLKLQESASDEELGKWLETNVPELLEIAQDEVDVLLGELAENTDGINSAE